MQPDHFPAGRTGAGSHGLGPSLSLIAALLYGCAAPAQPVSKAPVSAPVTAPPASALAQAPTAPSPVDLVLGYADRIRGLQPPELAQEIVRLGDAGDSATRLMQLTLALGQSKVAANGARAQALLQRVLGQNEQEARALHPLARLIAAQLAEARRADEQIERHSQQLRDAQRRIDQLNDRLEAVRAIERSLPSRPASGASGPAARP